MIYRDMEFSFYIHTFESCEFPRSTRVVACSTLASVAIRISTILHVQIVTDIR